MADFDFSLRRGLVSPERAGAIIDAATFKTVTLADDTATSFSLPGASPSCIVVINCSATSNPSPRGMFFVRASASPGCSNIAMVNTTNITFTTGALTGTTGTNGNITISGHTDGNLYIENRSGAPINISLRFLTYL